LLAERYARAARIDLNEEVDFFVSDACYHLAILKYLRSSDCARENNPECARRLLREAILHSEASPSPTSQHRYHEARCRCLLGEHDEALNLLFDLSDSDRRFALVALKEPDFSALTELILEIPGLLRKYPGPATTTALATLDAAFQRINDARETDLHGSVQSELNDLDRNLKAADQLLDTGGIETAMLIQKGEQTQNLALQCAKRAFAEQVKRLNVKIQTLQSRKVRPEVVFDSDGLWLWSFPIVSVPVGVLITAFLLLSDQWGKHEGWWWGSWGVVSVLSTCTLLYKMQVKSLRDRRFNEKLELEMSQIRAKIDGLKATAQGLKC
jgi:hypothetical protein